MQKTSRIKYCMKYIFTVCIFFGKSAFLFAQINNGSLHGKVLDSVGKGPLELANIMIYKLNDSSVKNKILTDRNGNFEIKKLPLYDSLELVISFTGYRDYHQKVSLNGEELLTLGNIKMK